MTASNESLLRPADWARLILASDDLLPRQRARDQQADIAGAALTRRVLERVAAVDPEPTRLANCLAQIVQEWNEPAGPVRAVARNIAEEFDATSRSPQFVEWLLERAVGRPEAAVKTFSAHT
jgi:hypothetical protein